MASVVQEHLEDLQDLLRSFEETPSSTHLLTTFLGEVLGLLVRQQRQLDQLTSVVQQQHERVADELGAMTTNFAEVLKQTVERTALAMNAMRNEMREMQQQLTAGMRESGCSPWGRRHLAKSPREKLRETQLENRIAALELLVEQRLHPASWSRQAAPAMLTESGGGRSAAQRLDFDSVSHSDTSGLASALAKQQGELDLLRERLRVVEVAAQTDHSELTGLRGRCDSLLGLFDIPKTVLFHHGRDHPVASGAATAPSGLPVVVHPPTPGSAGAVVEEALVTLASCPTLRKVEFLHQLPCFHAMMSELVRQSHTLAAMVAPATA